MRFIDLTGQRFGRLTVLQQVPAPEHLSASRRRSYFSCRCDCGNLKTVAADNLRQGNTKSCGCLSSPDLTGQRFGKLVVLYRVPKPDHLVGNGVYVLCRCDCGNTSVVYSPNVHAGRTLSCGCLIVDRLVERQLTHGQSRAGAWTPSYRSWHAMKQRCDDPNAANYDLYGGRGITISPELQTFGGFYAYMGDRPEGTSIDRIDPDGNYEPGNVRWATYKQQNNNQRRHKKTNPVAA